MIPLRHLLFVLALPTLAVTSSPSHAQDDAHFRFGISVGGISTLGLIAESVNPWGSVEVILGTWAFRDVSIATTYKRYLGGGDVQGVAGVGFWTVFAFPPDERTGVAVVARLPLGVQWQVEGVHFLQAEIGVSRALAIRRTDPEDDTPPNNRLVPLPGVSYRIRDR